MTDALRPGRMHDATAARTAGGRGQVNVDPVGIPDGV